MTSILWNRIEPSYKQNTGTDDIPALVKRLELYIWHLYLMLEGRRTSIKFILKHFQQYNLINKKMITFFCILLVNKLKFEYYFMYLNVKLLGVSFQQKLDELCFKNSSCADVQACTTIGYLEILQSSVNLPQYSKTYFKFYGNNTFVIYSNNQFLPSFPTRVSIKVFYFVISKGSTILLKIHLL